MGIQIVRFSPHGGAAPCEDAFSTEQAERARRFHQGLEGYAPTPLRALKDLAHCLGIAGLYVKDESARFHLNAFKALGGSYALHRVLAERGAGDTPLTFVTATDGNHGRGVAWAARQLGQKAVVYMPRGSSPERLENIRALGAQAEITPLSYDDAVRFARDQAEENGWCLLQDTAWPGYEQVPVWIMQGYLTLALETVQQLGTVVPTHLFLQAGVGSMAGAVSAFFHQTYGARTPRIAIVEPEQAACLFATAQAADGTLHPATGTLESIMAGLCCGEVCTLGWKILSHRAGWFFSCPDHVAADGMRVLGNPLGSDERIISGESGAVTTGLVYHLLRDSSLHPLRDALGLDRNSVVLCISTEGDTDRANYRSIVWDGAYHQKKNSTDTK